jgi:hypothetical protein
MQTATYTDDSVREAIRSRAISYIETDVAPGLTLDEHRRALKPRRSRSSALRRTGRALRQAVVRYPDDPVGDYETTDGGW